MKPKKRRRTLKRKVRTGFVVVGAILFFSGVIAIFEFIRIARAPSGVINDSILSIDAEHSLMQSSEEYNMKLLSMLESDTPPEDYGAAMKETFAATLEALPDNFTTAQETTYADSVRLAYAAYMQVVMEAPQVWDRGLTSRYEW